MLIEKEDEVVIRTQSWPEYERLPTASAENWYCKYKVMTRRDMIDLDRNNTNDPTNSTVKDKGRIILQVFMEGFDDYAYMILQAHNFFTDIKDNQDPDKVQRFY